MIKSEKEREEKSTALKTATLPTKARTASTLELGQEKKENPQPSFFIILQFV